MQLTKYDQLIGKTIESIADTKEQLKLTFTDQSFCFIQGDREGLIDIDTYKGERFDKWDTPEHYPAKE